MNIVNTVMHIILRVFTDTVLIIAMYYLVISFFGLYRKKDNKKFEPEKDFAIIVAAHNEEAVIGDMVESLNKLDYPKELYDIYVISDNSDDNTTIMAREKVP